MVVVIRGPYEIWFGISYFEDIQSGKTASSRGAKHKVANSLSFQSRKYRGGCYTVVGYHYNFLSEEW